VTKYVLITSAHNESAFLETTIRSVISQSVRPLKWVIVNDASSDGTREIIEEFARNHTFIKPVNVVRPGGRHFGNKVRAFERGMAELAFVEYDFIGNLDADITVTPEYFKEVLRAFADEPRLGISGGMIYSSHGNKYICQNVALDSVAGAVQFFRRHCFQQVGGYMSLPYGGIDTAAEIIARMKGWKVRTIAELRVLEHRRTGSATARPLASRVKEGQRMQSLGYGPLFFLARCVYRAREAPTFVGSCAAYWGYVAGHLRGEPIALPPDAVLYLRAEHRAKLKQLLGLTPAVSLPSRHRS
jgi:poly-beta-1,6-N-acetyl-D-glucosamine synthase